jgi:hypothetical protein
MKNPVFQPLSVFPQIHEVGGLATIYLEEGLAKFGYRLERKVEMFRNP